MHKWLGIIRFDRNRHGGGVFLFTKSVYIHNTVFSGSSELIVSVSTNSVPLTLALFYHPPGSPFSTLDNLLTALCNYVDLNCLSNLVLLGDFNVNTSHSLFSKLLLLCNSLSLTQVVTFPTHI